MGAYTFEAGLVSFGLHRLLGPDAELTLRTAGVCCLLILVVDLLMSAWCYW